MSTILIQEQEGVEQFMLVVADELQHKEQRYRVLRLLFHEASEGKQTESGNCLLLHYYILLVSIDYSTIAFALLNEDDNRVIEADPFGDCGGYANANDWSSNHGQFRRVDADSGERGGDEDSSTAGDDDSPTLSAHDSVSR